jgi:hypothetical protein
MIDRFFRYATNRAADGAIEAVSRQATWIGLAILLFLSGAIISLIVIFQLLAESLGFVSAGVILAAASIAVGIICLSMPRMIERVETSTQTTTSPVAETMAEVQQDIAQAVDYFGAIRVVASAFLLGLGAARQIKHPFS